MDRRQIEITLLTVFATVLKCDINIDTSRKNTPEWDSLKHIEIIFTLEDELGMRFSEEELANLNSVRVILDRALSHYAS